MGGVREKEGSGAVKDGRNQRTIGRGNILSEIENAMVAPPRPAAAAARRRAGPPRAPLVVPREGGGGGAACNSIIKLTKVCNREQCEHFQIILREILVKFQTIIRFLDWILLDLIIISRIYAEVGGSPPQAASRAAAGEQWPPFAPSPPRAAAAARLAPLAARPCRRGAARRRGRPAGSLKKQVLKNYSYFFFKRILVSKKSPQKNPRTEIHKVDFPIIKFPRPII